MAVDSAILTPELKAQLVTNIKTAFNLTDPGYDDSYLQLSMEQFASAIASKVLAHLVANMRVLPEVQVGGADATNRLYIDVPVGSSTVRYYVEGKGKVE